MAELLEQRANDESTHSSYASWLHEQVQSLGAPTNCGGASHANQLVQLTPDDGVPTSVT